MEKNKEKVEKVEKNENKKIMILVVAILIVMGVVYFALNFIKIDSGKDIASDDISKILNETKESVIYIENSDSKKCDKCADVKKYLNEKNIEYYLYDADENSKKDYEKMLQSLNINPDDFNYPAVIYIKDGIMYSNIINISDTKVVEQFIKDYSLNKVSK